MLLTACSSSEIDKATDRDSVDSALCTELEEPINEAIDITIDYSDRTPAPVINSWTLVVKGFDAGCQK